MKQTRRKWSVEQKLQMIQESVTEGVMMWSGKTGLEKSQIKPEITHPYETRTKKVHQ